MVFLKTPAGETPEDELLVQFQGMIAEYERAQIAERSRRGKRHKAQQGVVSVLSGAPYGYRYVKKSDRSEAYYEVIEAEAAPGAVLLDIDGEALGSLPARIEVMPNALSVIGAAE